MTRPHPDWQYILQLAQSKVESVADLAMQICAIAAPTGSERARAEFVAAQYALRGCTPQFDEVGNIYITRSGSGSGRVVLALAHTDTVFPAETPLKITRQGNVLRGPGIGDNAMSIAALIGVLEVMDALHLATDHDLVLCHNVGEEGLGNLRGAWAAVRRYQPHLSALIAVDGHYGRILHTAVGSRRFEVSVRGPGGHSYGAFGAPSAIHGLAKGIAAVAALNMPPKPKTTYNVGLISGGSSVNTIAAQASAVVDVRSEDATQLARIADEIEALFCRAAGDGLKVEITVLGERPAGSTRPDHALVQSAARALIELGTKPIYDAGSTDANVPISLGIPAITIGVYEGEGAHSLAECAHVGKLGQGMAQVLRVLMEAACL